MMLFSAPMVRAILEGRKAQTRRAMKPQPEKGSADWEWPCSAAKSMVDLREARGCCPYGIARDRLWVKETWAAGNVYDGTKPTDIMEGAGIAYAASGGCVGLRLRPSIFMRRWMSRITLEIVSVRVERLQDITEADAVAEGIAPLPLQEGMSGAWYSADVSKGAGLHSRSPVGAFRKLWASINGDGSWVVNPWVWRIEFRRAP